MHITNIRSILLLSFIFLLSACSNTKLSSLKVEYETTPLGIDIEKPRFSWQMTSDKHKQSQSAYQIIVTDEAGEEIWDTGKVVSDISLNIEYAGNNLEATTRYEWTLQVWNQDDKLLSTASWFETGLMNPSITAWDGAKWIGGGAENNPPSLHSSHHFEVCKFYSLDEHTIVPDVVVISKKVWDKLDSQQKKWVQQAADESAILERKLWAASEIESMKKVQEAGVKVNYPDKQPFIDKVQPLIESYSDNEVIYNYIKRIQAVQ